MPMANEKWNLNTTGDLTAEPGSPVGLVNPPLTADARAAARPAGYGDEVVPPKPIWYTDQAGNPNSHGVAEPHKILLFWRSNVGEQAADLNNGYFMGAAGLQAVGVTGHKITVNGAGDVHHPSGETCATITGYFDRTDPLHPLWVPLQPDTDYTFTVAAHNENLVYGPASDALTVHTPALGYDAAHLTLPPRMPNNVEFAAPLPQITSAAGAGIQLRWSVVAGATKYEIYDNSTATTTDGMDPSRIGLNTNDVKLGEVNQPAAGVSTATFTTPAYTVPGQAFALKVRAVRTDANGTAVSDFSPVLRGHIPAATNAPGEPAAPTLTVDPIVGGLVELTLTEPTVDATHGAPEWYALYDGTAKIATLSAPLGAAPQVQRQYATGQNYSFTVVAGNSAGISTPSAALTGTVPA